MTIVEKNLNVKFVQNKYLQKSHNLLIFLRDEIDLGHATTINDIIKGFRITRAHAYKLLELLENDMDVFKGDQVQIGKRKYHNYMITPKARQELQVLAKATSENYDTMQTE